MKLQLTPKPRAYIGLAAYTNFLNNDPFHYERTKWNGLLIKKGMKCRPFRLQQLGDCLCAVHSDENELLATRMTLDHEPLPHLGPDDGLVAMLRRNNVLTYWRGAISVRACLVAGCARITWAGFAASKRGEANRARRSETSACDVETGEAMTPAPIRRRGRRLISTGQFDPSISRGRRLNGARLGGREPLALALAFRLGPPSAHVFSRSPHDVEKPILRLRVIRPPSSKKHARTNLQTRGS